MDAKASEVLDFWFGEVGSDVYGAERKEWFIKSDAFDEDIRSRFGEDVRRAIDGEYDHWAQASAPNRQTLSFIVLLDQFPRNIYRNTGDMYAGDEKSLAAAQAMVAAKRDLSLLPIERVFCYLPYEHSESLAVQEESLRLFGQLVGQPAGGDFIKYAKAHHVIVERFGRFPHRNELLGRSSTEEEIAFLKEPGSSF
jgi:uncharacterized protein (DUF924 family)